MKTELQHILDSRDIEVWNAFFRLFLPEEIANQSEEVIIALLWIEALLVEECEEDKGDEEESENDEDEEIE